MTVLNSLKSWRFHTSFTRGIVMNRKQAEMAYIHVYMYGVAKKTDEEVRSFVTTLLKTYCCRVWGFWILVSILWSYEQVYSGSFLYSKWLLAKFLHHPVPILKTKQNINRVHSQCSLATFESVMWQKWIERQNKYGETVWEADDLDVDKILLFDFLS